MKYRTGFVTNSSSSSFICQVCGNTESGMDMSMRDANMVQCKLNHTFCEGHMIDGEAARDSDDDDYPYEVDPKHCPICQFKEMDVDDVLVYLMKEYNLTKYTILATIQGKFGTYKEFNNYLKGKK